MFSLTISVLGDEDDGLLYRCAGSKADRMLFRFGGKAFFAVVGVFIKSALTAEQCVSTKGQKRMKKKILRTASFALATALSLSVCVSAFVSDGTNNNVTTSVLPDSADNAVLNWATKVGKSWNDGPSPVAIVGDNIVYTSGDKLMRMNKETGVVDSVVGQRAGTNSYAIQPVTYADGMIFSAFNGGIQAFDADTLESLWVYKDSVGGQSVSPIYYNDGCIYTGFCNYGSGKDDQYVCIDVKDEDPDTTDEEKSPKWTFTNKSGFYWAGAYATDDFVVLGMENAKANTTDPARIVTLDKNSGSVIDTEYTVGGGVRSTISYDKDTDAYYFTSNGGYFYKATIDDEGNFTKLDSIPLGGASTSTPTVLNGRAYVGVNGSGWGDYKGSVIAVIDLDSFKIAYKAETKGYPQTSGLGVVNENGYNYVYFSENASAGAIRYVKDKKGVTEVLDAQIVNGKKTAPSLFTPTGAQAQYAIADLVADENGTIYFKNDSGYIMAVGSEVEKLVTENAKTVCKEGEAYDASDLKVYAVLKNGAKKDVTDYVTIDDTALTADDDFVTVTYKYGMYRDKTNEGAANTTGVAVSPVEATIDVTVLAAEDYDSVKAVEKLISDLGEITLDSENDIKAARAAYYALGDLKEYVGNVDALTAAEEKLEELKTPSSSSEAESSVSSSDVSSESTVSSANSEDTSSATSSAAESVSSADTSKAADSSSKTANNAGAANPNTGATAGVCVAGLALLISGALTVSRKRK
ncbi:NPXTG-anchored protein [Ruminococcus sp.]|uniref:NPXTG-anchored protein n=1 Tax=Ruminococcus sp. TaxID=41978 RepID=UPI003AB4B050